ncbi:unnamed protein product, partial [Rotaria socialis]
QVGSKMVYSSTLIAIIIIGTIGLAIAGPPTNCVCAGIGTGCNTAGCSAGNDDNCTHCYLHFFM